MTYRTVREELKIAKEGMIKQGVRSTFKDDNGRVFCKYRGEAEGSCCAIGFLIPDDEAKLLDAEGTVPYNSDFFSMATSLNPDNEQFYIELQGVHDEFLPEEWEEELDKLEFWADSEEAGEGRIT